MTVRLVRTIEIARIAKTAGFDMLYIDLEHSPLTIDATGQICMACAGRRHHARRAGAGQHAGIYLAGCSTPARSASSRRTSARPTRRAPWSGPRSCRRRASAATPRLFPHLQYRSFPAAETCKAINDATMVIVQFESADALERADEIVAVEGVDIVLVGLNDMLADMGLARAIRPSQGARDLLPRHRGLPQARQALRRRRARLAARPDRRIRPDGRALRLERHRPRLPARGCDRSGRSRSRTSSSDGRAASHSRPRLRQRLGGGRVRALGAVGERRAGRACGDSRALPGPRRPARRRHPRPVPPADLSRPAAQWADQSASRRSNRSA